MARLPKEDEDLIPMTYGEEAEAIKATGGPPLDLRVLLFGTLKRWPIILLIAGLSFLGGQIAGGKIGNKKSFEAETILRYQATGENSRYIDQKTVILTLKDTLKIRENIEELRDRLGLQEDLGKIGKAIDIRVQKNTTLLVISAKWKTARGAAEMVNTLRDIFLERYAERMKGDIRRTMADLNLRLATVRADLKQRDHTLQQFTTDNRIVDIEKQSRAMLEEFNNYGVLLEQAQAEKKTVDEQARKLDRAINQLKARVNRESKNMAQLENLADVNTRIERIRDAIKEDQDTRANIAELALRKQEMERMKRLLDKGYVSEAEYQRAATAYETQRIRTEDTDETRRLREEREHLQQQIIPRESGTAPSAPILTDMLKRTFEIQLEQIAVTRKVQSLDEARKKVKQQLNKVPLLQQQYDALQRNISSREGERKELEAKVAQIQRDLDSRADDFTIVSVAEVDKESDTGATKAKMIGYVIAGVGTLFGIAFAAGLEFLNTTIRTPQQAATRLVDLALLGTFPVRRNRRQPLVTPEETDFAERLAMTARRIRRAFPVEGACVLIVGANPDEGVGTVARNLASALARQDESILLIDLRPDALLDNADLLKGLPPSARLSEYLEGNDAKPEELLYTLGDRLHLLPRDSPALSPDRLGSQRMASLLTTLSAGHDLTLLAAGPLLKSNEAELLSSTVNGVLLVVRAGKTPLAQIDKARKKLAAFNVPVLGMILNGARWPYIHWE